jgi:hypothetical protein
MEWLSNLRGIRRKIELTDCGGRLCAYASTNQGENHKDWKAPWKGKNGLPVLILRGY